VDARWLDAIRAAMCDDESGQVALVGGPVEPRWERQAPAWLKLGRGYGRMAAPLALLDYGQEPADLGPRTLLGANMAVRRDVLQTLGGLRPHLGKLRGTLLSGEDHELCQRVQRAGFRARYCPQAIVRHFVPDDRLRVGYFLKWFFWSGITNAQLDTDDHPQPGRRAVPRYFIRMFAAGALGAVAAALTWKWHQAVDRATQAAFAAGYAARKLGGI
jgi:GT2 family glycosyltransferase